jgi:uncharacterized protein (DUF433 family)
MITLVESGIYSVEEASRLLQTTPRKIRGWIDGYPRTKSEPVLKNDLGWLKRSLAFSFANLMEMRFIEFFAARGVRVSSIRAMAEEAQRILDHPHPFATSTIFTTDGRKIFAKVASEADDPRLYDLKEKNWAMLPVIQQSLLKDTEYNPRGDAVLWRPRVNVSPSVVIHPSRSFGQPILAEAGVPTRTVSDAWEAEGDLNRVAEWFEISAAHVLEAVEFEQRLAMAA